LEGSALPWTWVTIPATAVPGRATTRDQLVPGRQAGGRLLLRLGAGRPGEHARRAQRDRTDQSDRGELCRVCDRQQEQGCAYADHCDDDAADQQQVPRVAEGEEPLGVCQVRIPRVEVGVPGKPAEGRDRTESRQPEGSA